MEGAHHTFAVVVSLALVACGSTASEPDAGSVGGCPPYVADADLSTPTTTFVHDVVPVFQTSCAVGGETCHGDPTVTASQRPFLGYFDGDGGAAVTQAVRSGLVGIKSKEDLLMNLVTAEDPAKSFLMHKMDGDQCTLISECMQGASYRPNCGVFMPYQYPTILDPDTRNVVRRWIAQGALDN
jgi:hypothetical protein